MNATKSMESCRSLTGSQLIMGVMYVVIHYVLLFIYLLLFYIILVATSFPQASDIY